MAVRKPKAVEPINTVLVRPKGVLKKELEAIIEAGETLFNTDISTPEQLSNLHRQVADWSHFNAELLKRAFNNHKNEYHYDYSRLNLSSGLADYLSGVNTNTFQYKVSQAKLGIQNYITFLKRFVTALPLMEEASSMPAYSIKEKKIYNCGFLIHGHNTIWKLEVARFIENTLGLKITILHERPNSGRTIIEKFEDYSAVDFAVALWTADDVGKANSETDLNSRARQNVVLETGFFIGAIGRKNVIILHELGVEIPSDYSGVIYTSLSGNWKDDLRKEIETIYLTND